MPGLRTRRSARLQPPWLLPAYLTLVKPAIRMIRITTSWVLVTAARRQHQQQTEGIRSSTAVSSHMVGNVVHRYDHVTPQVKSGSLKQ